MIADGIHSAIAGVGFPLKDRFQKINRLPKEQFIYDDRHPDLNEARSEKFVCVCWPQWPNGLQARDALARIEGITG